MDGKSGTTRMLFGLAGVAAERVLLVGLGSESGLGPKEYREAVRTAVAAAADTGAAELVLCFGELPVKGADAAWRACHAALAATDALYRFDAMKSKKSAAARAQQAGVRTRAEGGRGRRGTRHRRRPCDRRRRLARQGSRQPPRQRLHARLSRAQAEKLARECEARRCEVLERRGDGEARHGRVPLGRPGLAPAAAVHRAPTTAAARRARSRCVLVGKGITFDTGGISIKPAAEMDEMKFDMCGAASVLGAFRAVAELEAEAERRRPRSRPRENMPGGARVQAGRHREEHVRPDDRDPQHRRRGPAHPVRRADLRRAVRARGGRRHRDAHRRVRDRARPRRERAVQRTATRSRDELVAAGRRGLRPRLAHAAVGRLPGAARRATSRTSRTSAGAPAGSVTAACFLSRFAGKNPLGAPRHRRHRVEARARTRARPGGRCRC